MLTKYGMAEAKKEETAKKDEPSIGLGPLLLVAVAGRLLFKSGFLTIPSVEPVLPTAVLAGMLYGPGSGAAIGALGYILSNLFLGSLDIWSVWQGLMGVVAGYVGGLSNRDNYLTNVILVTVIFEIVINFIGAGYTIDSQYFLGSLEFSILHIASNVVFASLFRSIWLKAPEEKK